MYVQKLASMLKRPVELSPTLIVSILDTSRRGTTLELYTLTDFAVMPFDTSIKHRPPTNNPTPATSSGKLRFV